MNGEPVIGVERGAREAPASSRRRSGEGKKTDRTPRGEISDPRRSNMLGVLRRHPRLFASAGLFVTEVAILHGPWEGPGDVAGNIGMMAAESIRTDKALPSFEDVTALVNIQRKIGHASVQDREHHITGKERLRQPGGMPEIAESESVGIPAKLLEDYLRTAFPKGWMDARHVSRIELNRAGEGTAHSDLPGLGSEWKTIAWCAEQGTETAPELVFTTHVFEDALQAPLSVYTVFAPTMAHEFAHAHDWRRSLELSARDAVALHEAILERSSASGHPQFAYPDAIHATSPDEEESAEYHRAEEYFAEFIAESLTVFWISERAPRSWTEWQARFMDHLTLGRGASSIEARANVAVARWFFQTVDLNFKPWQAAQEGQKILDQMATEVGYQQFSGMIVGLPDDLQGVLQERMDTRKEEMSPEAQAGAETRRRARYRGVTLSVSVQEAEQAYVVRAVEAGGENGVMVFEHWRTIVSRALEIRTEHLWPREGLSRSAWLDLQSSLTLFADLWNTLTPSERAMLLPLCEEYAESLLHPDAYAAPSL